MRVPEASLSRLSPVFLLAAAFLFVMCGSPQQKLEEQQAGSAQPRPASPYTVVLTYNDKASRAKILYEDMGLNVQIEPITPMPYSDNANTGIWIGTAMPPDQIFQVIDIGRRYYRDLRYVALSDRLMDAPNSASHQVQIGTPTETALRMGLRAWTERDFAALKSVKTEQELRNLVESKYSKRGESSAMQETK